MNRSIVDRASIDAELARLRASKSADGHGGWAAKVGVIPAAVAGLVNRIFHRETPQPVPLQVARRRAGVYVWRQAFGPDGQPLGEAEIIPVPGSDKYRVRMH